MSSARPEFKLGRVVITEHGIRQSPFLLIFGEKFNLTWDEIQHWSSTQMLRKDVTTGKEKLVYHIIELQTQGNLHTITVAGNKAGIGDLLALVRRYLPNKEVPSILETLNRGFRH